MELARGETTPCMSQPLDLFFVKKPSVQRWVAQRVCAQCPFSGLPPDRLSKADPGPAGKQGACLIMQMRNEGQWNTADRYGVWGGLSPHDRWLLIPTPAGMAPIPEEVHGTHQGYGRHRDRKEKPCPGCAAAMTAYQRTKESRQPKKRRPPAKKALVRA